MSIADNAHKIANLTEVLNTVHADMDLTSEKYAGSLSDGDMDAAQEMLRHQKSLIQQADFLISELSELGGDTAFVPAVDPAQMDLLGSAEVAILAGTCDPSQQAAMTFHPGGHGAAIGGVAAALSPGSAATQTPSPVIVAANTSSHHANIAFGECYGVDWAYVDGNRLPAGEKKLDVVPAEDVAVIYRSVIQRRVINAMVDDERYVLECVANRIAGNAHPEEDSRLDVAYAISRHLGLDWPSAQLDVPHPTGGVAKVIHDLRKQLADKTIEAHDAKVERDRAAAAVVESNGQVELLRHGRENDRGRCNTYLRVIEERNATIAKLQQPAAPAGHFTSSVLVSDTEAAAKVIEQLIPQLVAREQGGEAAVLAEAQEILLRGSFGAAIARGVQPTQDPVVDEPLPRMAEGDVAIMTDFAVNPETDSQLVIGLLRPDNALAWTMAGPVPSGSFTTMRQRLQMFADTVEAVTLSKACGA